MVGIPQGRYGGAVGDPMLVSGGGEKREAPLAKA